LEDTINVRFAFFTITFSLIELIYTGMMIFFQLFN